MTDQQSGGIKRLKRNYTISLGTYGDRICKDCGKQVPKTIYPQHRRTCNGERNQ